MRLKYYVVNFILVLAIINTLSSALAHEGSSHGAALVETTPISQKKEGGIPLVEGGQKILKGKIVDISCLLTHNSQGENHKQCARDCALKGLPFGVLAEDGLIYQVIPVGHADPKTANQGLMDYLEDTVVIDGHVFIKNGMRVVTINKISKL